MTDISSQQPMPTVDESARGTIWETHFDNIINTFWVTLVAGLAFGILCVFVIGIPLLFGLAIWFLYRTIKGLVRAIDNKAYF